MSKTLSYDSHGKNVLLNSTIPYMIRILNTYLDEYYSLFTELKNLCSTNQPNIDIESFSITKDIESTIDTYKNTLDKIINIIKHEHEFVKKYCESSDLTYHDERESVFSTSSTVELKDISFITGIINFSFENEEDFDKLLDDYFNGHKEEDYYDWVMSNIFSEVSCSEDGVMADHIIDYDAYMDAVKNSGSDVNASDYCISNLYYADGSKKSTSINSSDNNEEEPSVFISTNNSTYGKFGSGSTKSDLTTETHPPEPPKDNEGSNITKPKDGMGFGHNSDTSESIGIPMEPHQTEEPMITSSHFLGSNPTPPPSPIDVTKPSNNSGEMGFAHNSDTSESIGIPMEPHQTEEPMITSSHFLGSNPTSPPRPIDVIKSSNNSGEMGFGHNSDTSESIGIPMEPHQTEEPMITSSHFLDSNPTSPPRPIDVIKSSNNSSEMGFGHNSDTSESIGIPMEPHQTEEPSPTLPVKNSIQHLNN